MDRHFGAWIRYGEPLDDSQIDFAINHYAAAILQPFESDAARRLKEARPDMTVICYKCLSSSRSYESGPILTSGVGFEEAEEAGEHWFAHRANGRDRIEWSSYRGHWQMAIWEDDYRARWVDNVADELEDSPWDGVMADNDVFDDYYGLRPPLEGDRDMPDLRDSLGTLIRMAGERLNAMGKVLIPNIAEARRQPGRWESHAAFGGGFEEVWLCWEEDEYFDPETVLAQSHELTGPGLSIMRVSSDGTDTHPNFLYGLATFWIFGGGERSAMAATSHDGYSTTPYIPQLDWDLGNPVGPPEQRGNGWSRRFTRGWAAVNINDNRRRTIHFNVPEGNFRDLAGEGAPRRVTLPPHHGVLFIDPS